MPYKLRKSIPGKLNVEIYQWEDIHGARLFQQRLYEDVQQNSKVQNVRILPQHKYLDIYENISEWSIREYRVPETLKQNYGVLKSISGISFINLKILDLSQLQIISIEPLIWLDSPLLQSIDLSDNKITSLRSLAKTYFRSLRGIQLKNNPVDICDQFHLAAYRSRMYNSHQIKMF